jgi:DinB superfamily
MPSSARPPRPAQRRPSVPRVAAGVAALAAALLSPARAGAQAASTPAASTPDALNATSAAFVRDQYLADLDTVHVKILALANAIPEDKYGWRPTPGVRSVSEVLMHVASEWYVYVPMSIGAKPPADFGKPREVLPKLEKEVTAKSDVIGHLNKSWAYSKEQVSSGDAARLTGKYKPWDASLPEAAFAMSGDLHEHLGQLIAYARSVGVKPPWSK